MSVGSSATPKLPAEHAESVLSKMMLLSQLFAQY